jgi:tetratricopeptide (TPR) repeat protein
VPWAQGINAYTEGMMVAGRIADLLAAISQLRDVEPTPDALGKMALAFLGGTCFYDAFGRIAEGTEIEGRFFAIIGSVGDREPIARFWWNILVGMRASYAHEDPWSGLEHSEAIQPIFAVTGGEQIFLNMELFRGLNRWYLGALEAGQQILTGIAAADHSLGVASSMRRFGLCWLLADRGALDQARALASQLTEYGHAHHNSLEEGRGRWLLAEVLRRMGDLDGADRELPAALAMAVPLEHPGVLATLSALRLAQGRAAEALAAAEDAVARCTAMAGCGMFRGAFVRLAHAEALHATGAHDAARRAIAAAQAHLFTIATRISDPDYKISFLDNVPENARTRALASAWLGDAARDV